MRLRDSYFIKILPFLLFIFQGFVVQAQSFVGIGYGTFNVPGAMGKFRGTGPTVKYEYITPRQQTTFYLDASYFTKSIDNGSVSITDDMGNPIGSANTQNKNAYIYTQIGVKKLFTGDADEKKLLPYLGGGAAVVFAKTSTIYQSTISHIDNDVTNRTILGFHFNAGLQYNINPVILELRGNFDLVLKPLVPTSDVSNILTNLRLSALIPFTK